MYHLARATDNPIEAIISAPMITLSIFNEAKLAMIKYTLRNSGNVTKNLIRRLMPKLNNGFF